jgi:ankyrin repeat protein
MKDEPDKFWKFLSALQTGLPEAEKFLESNPEAIVWRNQVGETMLHYLAVEGDMEGVTWLIRHGASARTGNYFGGSVLDDMKALGRQALYDLLAAHGARGSAK